MSSTEASVPSETDFVQDRAEMEKDSSSNSISFISASITTILAGLDYIFYIWTILLIIVIAYLSIYKYYKSPVKKDNKQKENRKNRTNPNSVLNYINLILKFLFNMITLFSKCFINLLLNKSSNSYDNTKLDFKNLNQDNLLINNCLKWFYLNSETNKNINSTFLSLLNSGNIKRSVSHYNLAA